MAGSAWGQSATGVTATSLPYNPQQNNYDLQAVNAYCSAFDAGQSHAWRSRYGWAAFCGPVCPTGQAACGRCLKIRRALVYRNNLMQNDACLHVQLTDTETEAQATASLLSAAQEAYTWTRMCLTKLIGATPTKMAMPKAAFSSPTTLSTVAID